MNNNTIFVYGTLKKNFENHFILDGADFLGEAITEKKYLLVKSGGLPFLIENSEHEKATFIKGELYKISDSLLMDVDELEGHPNFYYRKPIWVKTKDDSIDMAWVYLVNNEKSIAYYEVYTIIEDGVWNF